MAEEDRSLWSGTLSLRIDSGSISHDASLLALTLVHARRARESERAVVASSGPARGGVKIVKARERRIVRRDEDRILAAILEEPAQSGSEAVVISQDGADEHRGAGGGGHSGLRNA